MEAYYIQGGLQQIGWHTMDPIGPSFGDHYFVIPKFAPPLHPWLGASLAPWRPIIKGTLGTNHFILATLQPNERSITLD